MPTVGPVAAFFALCVSMMAQVGAALGAFSRQVTFKQAFSSSSTPTSCRLLKYQHGVPHGEKLADKLRHRQPFLARLAD